MIEGSFVFIPLVIRIPVEGSPEQTPGAPPVIQHNPLLERLAPGGNHDEIVLGIGSGIRFTPVLLERF